MRVYLSGPQGSWRSEMEGHHLLVSYAEARQIKLLDAGWDVPGWLVDSGAFTSWTKGRPIDLDAYIAFLVGLEARAAAGALVPEPDAASVWYVDQGRHLTATAADLRALAKLIADTLDGNVQADPYPVPAVG